MEEYQKLYPLAKSNIIWKLGYGEDLPFSQNRIDAIFSSNALDHFEDYEKAIS